jgi:hypothetical protein
VCCRVAFASRLRMDALKTTGVFSRTADTNPPTIDKNA